MGEAGLARSQDGRRWKGGAPQSWRAGAVKNTDRALKNPLDWTEKTLIPALQKSGTNVDDPLELSKALGTMFRNQNANRFAEQITQLRARSSLHNDSDLIDKLKPPDEMYFNNLKTDPTQAIKAVTASLDSLAAAVSSPGMQAAATFLTGVVGGFQSLAQRQRTIRRPPWPAAQRPLLARSPGRLMNGFGLATSATALDGAASLLSTAAAELSGASVVSKRGAVASPAAAAAGGVSGPLALPRCPGSPASPRSAAASLPCASLGGAGYDGLTSGQRLDMQRGGSLADARLRAWNSDRSRLGVPALGGAAARRAWSFAHHDIRDRCVG